VCLMGAGICVPDYINAEEPLTVHHVHSEARCKAVAESVQYDPGEKVTVGEEPSDDSEQVPSSDSGHHLKGALWLEASVAMRMASADTTDETDVSGYSVVADTSDSESGEETIPQFLAEDSTTAVDTAEIVCSEENEASDVVSTVSDAAFIASLEEAIPQFLAEDSTTAADTAEFVCLEEREASDVAFAASDTAFTALDVIDLKSGFEAAATPSLPIVFEHHGKLTEVSFEKRPLGFEFGGKFVAPSGKFVITKVVRPELRDVVKLGMLIKKVGDETTANLEFQDFAALLDVATGPLPEDT